MFLAEHYIQASSKMWRHPSSAIIIITTDVKIQYHEATILLIKPSCLQQYIAKIFHFTKTFCQINQIALKMNTFFNSEVYWGCFQRTFIFEFYFYYMSVTQSSL